MLKSCRALLFTLLSLGVFAPVIAAAPPDAEQLFKQKCSLCHAIDKKKLGPAVSAMSRDVESLRETLMKGKNAMPGFEGKLTGAEIDALVDYLVKKMGDAD